MCSGQEQSKATYNSIVNFQHYLSGCLGCSKLCPFLQQPPSRDNVAKLGPKLEDNFTIFPDFNVCCQMGLQRACPRRRKNNIGCIFWLFSTIHFQMSCQIASLWGCKLTLVAFVCVNDIVSHILQDFWACILATKVKFFKRLFHIVVCVLCFAQMIASNWVKFAIIDLWTIITIVNFLMIHFHFLIIGQQIYWKEGDTGPKKYPGCKC